MNALHRLLLGIAATLGIAAAQISLSPCATDAEMTVGQAPQGLYFDYRSSNTTAYYTEGCFPEYTVDITVPGTFTVPGQFKDLGWKALSIAGGFDHGFLLTEQNCQYASESFVVLKRTFINFHGWSEWQPYVQTPTTGKWVSFTDTGNPYCAIFASIRVVPPSNGSVVDQYRVKVLPTLYGSPVPATVDWVLSQ